MRRREYICPAISPLQIDDVEIMAGSGSPEKKDEQGSDSHFSKRSLWELEENKLDDIAEEK